MKTNHLTPCNAGKVGRNRCHSCRYFRPVPPTPYYDGECHVLPPHGTRNYWPAVFSTDEACIFWHSNRPSIWERLKLAMLKLTLYFFLLR